MPETLHALVHDRLAGLPDETRVALAVMAALAQPTMSLVEAATGDRRALEAAVNAQVVELHGERVRFVHPLLASAAYGSIDPGRRRDLHRRLATLAVDSVERARHLSAATVGPDERVARALEDAAGLARGRGAPGTAAELTEEARRLTPDDRRDDGLRRLLAAAHYSFEAGDASRARMLFEDAVALAPPGPRRADALARLAEAYGYEGDLRIERGLLRAAMAEAGAAPAVRALAHAGLAVPMVEDLPRAAGHLADAIKAAERQGDDESIAEWLIWQAMIDALLARPGALELARRAVELTERDGGPVRLPWVLTPGLKTEFFLGVLLSWSDDLPGARERFERAQREAVELGDEASLPLISRAWSYAEWLAGS